MIHVEKTKLDGVLLIKPETFEDFRGNYTMTFNQNKYLEAFKKHGLRTLLLLKMIFQHHIKMFSEEFMGILILQN